MEPDGSPVADLFDAVADTYDNVGVDFMQPIARGLVEALAPQPGERALDVGCGAAALFPLAEAVAPGGRVTAIDLAPRMVAATAADVAAAGLDPEHVAVEVRVGDAMAPDVEPGSVDLVASSLVLFFLPDPAAALAAWRQLLVAGGRVGVSTFGAHSAAWHDVDGVFAPYLPPGLPDPRNMGPDSPFGSDAGVEGLLAEAGFDDVRTETWTVPLRFADADQWHRWSWSVGQRRMWLLVPEAERAEVRARAETALEATRDDQGRIGFDQVVRYTLARR
ncbi:MAG: methyltransferase domain-containing protein [Acidimicrobiales bacterium]